MDDSPRSSKRRKLDTPKRIVSSPLAKGSTKRASGRLSTRSTSYANGSSVSEVPGEATPKRRGLPLPSTRKSTPGKRAAVEDIDVYDDIEGALSASISPRPTQPRLQTSSRDDTARTREVTDELQKVATTPKRTSRRPAKPGTATRSEEGKGTPATSARKAAVPRSSGRKKKEQSPELEADRETDEPHNLISSTTPSKERPTKKTAASTRKQATTEAEEVSGTTPSKSSKKRKPLQERTEVPETEDELGGLVASSIKKLTASARRRLNRADHTNNQNEEHWSDVEEQVNGHEEDDMEVDGNSVAGSVLDPTEPSPFNKPSSSQKTKIAPPLLYGNFEAGQELDLLKTIVIERITGKRPSPLIGLDEEYKSVYQLVEHTITAGEGNSMLVIGARGSGKSALVQRVLSEVAKGNGGDYHVVRLNGFIHTDDKIALREIWRQLGKEMDIEEDGSGPGKNYADTLTTLLALLSHPSEQTGELTDQVAKAVIFVMDEFDLFAQHPRQTLLYNLFDIAQSRKAPIAVLGLTTRIDVTNSLEKRVKSRFSHRYVHLSLAKTFAAFQEICKACLTVQSELLSVEERGILEGGSKFTAATKAKKDTKQSVLAEWNANINVSQKSPLTTSSNMPNP
ncbi:origin recognition complex subunit 4 [Neocucurbitaria cava]|uniref:Origin recognition complex subunit 4 n=1 Tax=Neocucurbitaria cava TaxID=798079 RepID=A0A9W9CHS7_9PLEO|nr:origin recognition complex subunit 4 [Neocucurbitaria cava]